MKVPNLGWNPVEVRHFHARSGAVVSEDDVVVEIYFAEVGQQAVVGFVLGDVVELELLEHVCDPAGAEGLPCAHLNATSAEEGPHGHFHRTSVGCRDDAADISFGQTEDGGRFVNDFFDARLSRLCAVRAADKCFVERFKRPTGALAARAG